MRKIPGIEAIPLVHWKLNKQPGVGFKDEKALVGRG
jgi:hypothetical protein